MKLSNKTNNILILGALVGIAFVLRYLFMTDHLGTWDSVDFALGLKRYDISAYQPHPPGYPIYMLFTKVFFSL